MNKKWLWWVWGIGGLVVLGLYFFLLMREPLQELPPVTNATLIQPAKDLPSFSLNVSTRNPSFSNRDLENHWTLLFFGYTSCPGICPATMQILKNVYGELQKQKGVELPQVALISIDPKRDDQQKLKQYVESFNPSFVGATGSEEELQRLTHELGVLSVVVPEPSETSHEHHPHYQIDHSASLFVINPFGKYHALFSVPYDAEKVVKDLVVIQKAYLS